MRLALVCTLASFLIACTSDSNSSSDLGTADLSSSLADLSITTLSCGELIDCQNNCASQSCVNNCNKQATATALSLLKALDNCLVAQCETSGDGGPSRCDDPNSQTCDDCYGNAQTEAGSCSPANDPACGTCATQLDACGNDA